MVVACHICKTGELIKYGEWSAEVFDTHYTLLQCSHCRTAMTNPLPDETTLQRFYKECYDFRWFSDHLWAKMRDAHIRVREYRQFLGERVLDFGGGLGYFSKAACETGYESITYDPYLNECKIEDGTWDSIVSLHVLEHVIDPMSTLVAMRRSLKIGGTLILAVPNFLSCGYQELGMNWVWAQPPLAHIYHFTPIGLSALLERAGFKIEKIYYCDRWDANLYSDLEYRDRYLRFDAEWFVSPYARYRIFQKIVAFRNSVLRFNALKHAVHKNNNYKSSNCNLSELCMVAKLTNS